MKKARLVAAFILSSLPVLLKAQDSYLDSLLNDPTLAITVGIGTATFFGDLKDPGEQIDSSPTLSIGVQFYPTTRFRARIEFSTFSLRGQDVSSDDPNDRLRNLSFKSTNYELSAVGIFDLLAVGESNYQRPNFDPYFFVGFGLVYVNPKAVLNGVTYALQPLQTEGIKYARSALVIPFGIGLEINVTQCIGIGFEIAWRKTFTDYIDDVSTVYRDNTGLDPVTAQLIDRSEGMIFRVGQRRGDPTDKDGYNFMQLRCKFYLNN